MKNKLKIAQDIRLNFLIEWAYNVQISLLEISFQGEKGMDTLVIKKGWKDTGVYKKGESFMRYEKVFRGVTITVNIEQ